MEVSGQTKRTRSMFNDESAYTSTLSCFPMFNDESTYTSTLSCFPMFNDESAYTSTLSCFPMFNDESTYTSTLSCFPMFNDESAYTSTLSCFPMFNDESAYTSTLSCFPNSLADIAPMLLSIMLKKIRLPFRKYIAHRAMIFHHYFLVFFCPVYFKMNSLAYDFSTASWHRASHPRTPQSKDWGKWFHVPESTWRQEKS
ncbi:hypothetical protein BgiBS90_010103 [Biomphalaria glabrata]|nr:hypothetical protein BgiBS90_010103 [Biomphalaria glabrata]